MPSPTPHPNEAVATLDRAKELIADYELDPTCSVGRSSLDDLRRSNMRHKRTEAATHLRCEPRKQYPKLAERLIIKRPNWDLPALHGRSTDGSPRPMVSAPGLEPGTL